SIRVSGRANCGARSDFARASLAARPRQQRPSPAHSAHATAANHFRRCRFRVVVNPLEFALEQWLFGVLNAVEKHLIDSSLDDWGKTAKFFVDSSGLLNQHVQHAV